MHFTLLFSFFFSNLSPFINVLCLLSFIFPSISLVPKVPTTAADLRAFSFRLFYNGYQNNGIRGKLGA
jgi:hypothetical protein